jgi:uncharacterized protein (UPF0332 family)
MTDESRRANVEAELDKADASLRAARTLDQAGLHDDCVARAYYAVFHLACAVLLTDGLEARSHSGVEHLFNLHFVRAGRVDPRHSKALARLQQFRLQADYARAFRFTPEGAAEELHLAEETSAALRDWLERAGYPSQPS